MPHAEATSSQMTNGTDICGGLYYDDVIFELPQFGKNFVCGCRNNNAAASSPVHQLVNRRAQQPHALTSTSPEMHFAYKSSIEVVVIELYLNGSRI